MRAVGWPDWRPSSRGLLVAVVGLLAISLVAPLWSTRMEAPQYQGDEALEVHVYAGRVAGDIQEIETLNEYVGVHLPLDTPELAAAPWVLGGLLLLALLSVAAPVHRRRLVAALLLAAMVSAAVGGAALLQYRLYQMGHERDRPIFEGVPDFTPPVLGTQEIANFTVHMALGPGAWLYVLAGVLTGWVLFVRGRRKRERQPSERREPDETHDEAGAAGRAGRGGGFRWSVAAVLAGLLFLAALFAGGMVLIPRYQAAHPYTDLQRSDADRVALDDLYLDLTLATPEFRADRDLDRYLGSHEPDSVLPVVAGLNTHTGEIGHMRELPGQLTLVGPEGNRFPSVTEPIVLSQHHNAYLMLFPARDHRGRPFLEMTSGTLAVEATGMGQKTVRRFEWDLPLQATAAGGGVVARLMLVVALASALLVVLSPCALELTLYYTAIISCTVTEGERAAAGERFDPAKLGQRRVLVNLGAFVAGFTLLYAASGATVGLIGAGVRQPLGAYSEAIQIFAGTLILFFAMRVAGLDRWVLSRWGRGAGASDHVPGRGLAGRLRKGLAALRRKGQARAREGRMRARDSFLVGLGLSSACLSCMGGAVLYPLLVYAGITSWYSGLITLGLYSLFIAVPMVFIALGFFRIRLSLARRAGFTRALRTASAVMLGGIGVLILSGNERVITDLAFHFLAAVSQWPA